MRSKNGNYEGEGIAISQGGLSTDMKLSIALDVAKGMAHLATHRVCDSYLRSSQNIIKIRFGPLVIVLVLPGVGPYESAMLGVIFLLTSENFLVNRQVIFYVRGIQSMLRTRSFSTTTTPFKFSSFQKINGTFFFFVWKLLFHLITEFFLELNQTLLLCIYKNSEIWRNN